jgi:hypothetical protein
MAARLAGPGAGDGAAPPEARGVVIAGRRVVDRGVDGAAVVDGGTVTATVVVVVSATVDSVDVGPVARSRLLRWLLPPHAAATTASTKRTAATRRRTFATVPTMSR